MSRRLNPSTAAISVTLRATPIAATATLLAMLTGTVHAQSSYAGAEFATLPASTTLSEATLRAFGAAEDAAKAKDPWQFQVAPFLWCAGLDADISVGNVSASASPSFNDILSNLDLALMGHVEVRKGKWSLFSDLVWMSLGDDNLSGPLGLASVDVRLQEFIGSLDLAYEVFSMPFDPAKPDGAGVAIEPYVGVRYTNVDGELNFFNAPTASDYVDWWDPLVGVRLHVAMTSRLAFVGRWDFGGWGVGSDHTWFVSGMVNWRLFDSVAVGAGYAALYQDYHGSNFDIQQTVQGPLVSLAFQL